MMFASALAKLWAKGANVRGWYEADYRVKWDSARALLADVAAKLVDFAGLDTGLSTPTIRYLKESTAKVDDRSRSAVNAAL
eukprot:5912452-Amphidinium_carterae.1